MFDWVGETICDICFSLEDLFPMVRTRNMSIQHGKKNKVRRSWFHMLNVSSGAANQIFNSQRGAPTEDRGPTLSDGRYKRVDSNDFYGRCEESTLDSVVRSNAVSIYQGHERVAVGS